MAELVGGGKPAPLRGEKSVVYKYYLFCPLCDNTARLCGRAFLRRKVFMPSSSHSKKDRPCRISYKFPLPEP